MFQKLKGWWNSRKKTFTELLQEEYDTIVEEYKSQPPTLGSLTKDEAEGFVKELTKLFEDRCRGMCPHNPPNIHADELKAMLDIAWDGVAYRQRWREIGEYTEKNRESMLENFNRIVSEDIEVNGFWPNGNCYPAQTDQNVSPTKA